MPCLTNQQRLETVAALSHMEPIDRAGVAYAAAKSLVESAAPVVAEDKFTQMVLAAAKEFIRAMEHAYEATG